MKLLLILFLCSNLFSTEVTFMVDMTNTPANSEGVYIVGGNQWLWNEAQNCDQGCMESTPPTEAPTGHAMQDDDGDNIWEVVVSIPFGETVTYKFRNGPCDSWDDCGAIFEDQLQDCGVGEWYDRQLTVNQEDEMSAGLYCYNVCEEGECGDLPDTFPVTFIVDLEITGSHSSGVYLVGGSSYLQGPLGILMNDDDGDEVWEVTVDLPPGTYTFKFRNGECDNWNNCPQEFWEDFEGECGVGEWGDREVTVVNQGFTYGPYCFDWCEEGGCMQDVPIDVMWRVQLEGEELSQALECGMNIYGNFNNFDFFINPYEMEYEGEGIFTLTETFTSGDELTYKYAICSGQDAITESDEGVGGCGTDFGGACTGTSNANWRHQTVPYIPTIFNLDYFDECPGYARVNFNVDMNNEAVSGAGVCIAGGSMPNGPEGTEMCDLDGDGIYSTTLPFPYDSHQTYKFINGCGTTWENPGFEDLSGLDCTEGIWSDRYVDVYEDNQFVGDVYGECTEILDNDITKPINYRLNSVYPNPFNPSTTISFSISFVDYISMKIYNLKGDLVEVLSEGYYYPGDHSIVWDASKYSSGLYIVRMQSNDFDASQIISLIK